MTPEQEKNVLSVDQFGDDFSSPGDHLLSDKFVTTRKVFKCCWCQGPIAKGERSRVSKCVMDCEIQTCRYCGECCQAMATDFDEDDCQHLGDRVGLHDADRQERNAALDLIIEKANA